MSTPVTRVFFEDLDPAIVALNSDAVAALPDAEKMALMKVVVAATTLIGIVERLEQEVPRLVAIHAKDAAALTAQSLVGVFGDDARHNQSNPAN